MSENTKPAPTTICVFCGGSAGSSPVYVEAARALAQAFHKNGIHLVYGGGSMGLMGEVARTLVSLSGPDAVHGIIPSALLVQERKGHFGTGKATTSSSDATISAPASTSASATISESTDPALSAPTYSPAPAPSESAYGRTTIVSSMHERKQMMTKLVLAGGPGSGFIALPGGFGTLEELAEVTTWNQIGIHEAGIVLFDVEGFWQPLIQWVQYATAQGFITERNSRIIATASDAESCVRELREYRLSENRAKLDWTGMKLGGPGGA